MLILSILSNKKNITFLFLLFSAFLFSQRIEMSLVWKKEKNKKWRDTIIYNTPYLKLKYINETNNSIFFNKLKSSFIITTFYPHGENDCKIKKKNKFDKDYCVVIRKNSIAWDILDCNDYLNKDIIEMSDIGNELSCIYKKRYKKYSNINNSYLKTRISKKDFVYLKPKKSTEEYYDLTGFAIFGGNYLFNISNYFDNNIILPKRKGYLFVKSNEIETDELKISFH